MKRTAFAILIGILLFSYLVNTSRSFSARASIVLNGTPFAEIRFRTEGYISPPGVAARWLMAADVYQNNRYIGSLDGCGQFTSKEEFEQEGSPLGANLIFASGIAGFISAALVVAWGLLFAVDALRKLRRAQLPVASRLPADQAPQLRR